MKRWILNGQEYKEGDKVRIVRQVEDLDPDGMGDGVQWENVWVDDMDALLDTTLEIESIDNIGVFFVGNGECSYAYPLASLELVSEDI